MNVPWMPKQKIADIAAGVIGEYESIASHEVTPPIPVEDIIKQYLNLKFGFLDFQGKLGKSDILGATYVAHRLICINEALIDDPRRFFTSAHEAGHWVLHRKLVKKAERSKSGEGVIFCRSRDSKKPIEWQADYFASVLLMPERMVRATFELLYGSPPLRLYNVDSCYEGPLCFDPCVKNWHLIASTIRKVGGFLNVSKQAMMYRLLDLGLVVNETNAPIGWKKTHK